MAMTRISDVIVPGMVRPGSVELHDVLDDIPALAPLSPYEAEPVQPSHNDLLRNALAIDDRLAVDRGQA